MKSAALGINNLIRRFLTQLILLNFRTHGQCLVFVHTGTIRTFEGTTSIRRRQAVGCSHGVSQQARRKRIRVPHLQRTAHPSLKRRWQARK